MDEQFQPLDNDEVLFVSAGRILMLNPTFKVGELLDGLAQAVSDREEDWSDESEGWFGEGLECQVLRFGTKGWQRGKVRLRLEFSPLEDRPPNNRREEIRRSERLESRSPRPVEKPEPRPEPRYSEEFEPEDEY
ncbi:MAG TPA: KGK domain-containing protein [Thermosynechococcaceae cyanobacterium]